MPEATERNATMKTTDKYDREASQVVFEAIARDTISNGGGTYRRETGARVDLTTGYTVGVEAVGVFGYTPGHTDPATVAEALRVRWPVNAPANAQYVGTWVDSDASLIFIDHVTVVPALNVAVALARRDDRSAIYDNAKGVYIDVDDPSPVVMIVAPSVFVADAPENAVVWAHGEAFCPDCGAPLSDIGSVRYFEQYDAALGQSPYGECVEYASYTVEQTAYCSACGAPLGFEDVGAR